MLENRPRPEQRSTPGSPSIGDGAPSPRLVFCIVTSRGRADSILVDLVDDGIASSDIAVLFLDPDRSVEVPEPAVPVPASSGAIRGVVAYLADARRVLMPGMGPVVMSGGLSTVAEAEGLPELPHVLQRFGVPAAEATRFAGRIAAGNFFIAVRTPYSSISDRACGIFIANKAEEVCTKMDVVRSGRGAIAGGMSRRELHS